MSPNAPRPFFLQRRGAAWLTVLTLLGSGAVYAQVQPKIDVYKSPTCECCDRWIEHLKREGFAVDAHIVDDLGAARRKLGMPDQYGSCHTAKVGGYVVEGHVPAADVRRMLTEKPAIAGISAPGMPMGSPGMEGPYPADRYDVVSFDAQGRTAVFSSH